MKCRWEEWALLRRMIIDRRRANPILHLIQLIVLEHGSELLLDRREARCLYMVNVSLLVPPCVEKMRWLHCSAPTVLPTLFKGLVPQQRHGILWSWGWLWCPSAHRAWLWGSHQLDSSPHCSTIFQSNVVHTVLYNQTLWLRYASSTYVPRMDCRSLCGYIRSVYLVQAGGTWDPLCYTSEQKMPICPAYSVNPKLFCCNIHSICCW